MAASSSSSSTKYDVFLSFRGADTRDNFTSHLHAALCRHGIVTFIDNRLDKGEEIESKILKSIEESSISVIIFSKHYANSTWCLDELVKILECKKRLEQKVVPVFYEVDPADVESQTGSFGVAFDEHHRNCKIDPSKWEEWSSALKEASYLTGSVSVNTRPESALVEEIVKDVLKKLRHLDSTSDFEDLVGVESQLQDIQSKLCIGLEDVRIIGLWGMGGIGKTTIARAIYDKFSSYFEGSCFIENVRERSSKTDGLSKLRHSLLEEILDEYMNPKPKFQMRQLRCKKVLIVLDDVDDLNQVEYLAGKHDWFGPGSRIILTSRDSEVFHDRIDDKYPVEGLNNDQSLHLFSLYAFRRKQPEMDWMELSDRVVSYAQGLPLALKVLGSLLWNKSKEEWESALKKLQKLPDSKIQKALKVSYDGLDREEHQIFLHIACFLKGDLRCNVIVLLDAYGFNTLISLRRLADKSLIIMSCDTTPYMHDIVREMSDIVNMHDLLQEMGKEIAVQENINEPGKRSRLWNEEDICDVLINNTGTDAESIFLNQSTRDILNLSPTVFVNMPRIQFLKFVNSHLYFLEGLEALPNKLRYLEWRGCPLKSLPSNLQLKMLVDLNFKGGSFERLWNGVQDLPNLERIDLSKCEHLIEMPNLSGCKKLKRIDCSDCTSLVEVSPSISCLSNLQKLILSCCIQIKSIPRCPTSLKVFILDWCYKVDQFPDVPTCINELYLEGTAMEEIPSSIEFLSEPMVMDLNCSYCATNMKNLSQFETLYVDFCRILRSMPDLPLCLQNLNATCCIYLFAEYLADWGWLNFRSYVSTDQNECINSMMQQPIQEGLETDQKEIALLTMILPGNEIPKWIQHQTDGFSISIQLPPNRYNFWGFTFSCVFEGSLPRHCSVKIECKFKSECSETLVISTGNSNINIGKIPCGQPNHVALFYSMGFNLEMINKSDMISCCNEALFEFSIQNYSGIEGFFKVTKCGVKPMYYSDEDQVQPNQTFTASRIFEEYFLTAMRMECNQIKNLALEKNFCQFLKELMNTYNEDGVQPNQTLSSDDEDEFRTASSSFEEEDEAFFYSYL